MSTPGIFEDHFQRMIWQALDGYNVTIFAYGQTSSGKTHTMQGTDSELGIIQLSAFEIFKKVQELDLIHTNHTPKTESKEIEKRRHESIVPPEVIKNRVEVLVSFIEIYNESVNDLIDPSRKNLEIREDKKNIVIEGLSKHQATTPEQIIEFVDRGSENRKIGATKMNSKSSRSHTVFRIELKMIEKNTQTQRKIIKSSVINLVDLAGSEGVGKMNVQGISMREGNNINKSLLALSNVIYKLGQRW